MIATASIPIIGNSINDVANLSTLDLGPNPPPYAKALLTWHSDKWKQATFEEFDLFAANHVSEIVDVLPDDHEPITTRFVYTRKFVDSGFLNKFKAWCVACGYLQEEGKDFDETFSPTGCLAILVQFLVMLR